MANEQSIEIRFTGGDIRPEIVRASDLADVLRAIDELVGSVALNEALTRDPLFLTSLTLVEESSLKLHFTPSDGQAGREAWGLISRSVEQQSYRRLPHRATRALRRVVEFTQTYNCESELRLPETDQVLARITPSMIVADAPLIRGETTLYGQVLRVGGRRPKVLIASHDNSGTVACDVNQDIARVLGGRLYTDIAVSGMAIWNAETLRIESFEIIELLPYQKTALADALRRISERFGKYYDKIDVDEFMSSVRGDKEG